MEKPRSDAQMVDEDDWITLPQAAKLLPGKPASASTLWRWVNDGRRGIHLKAFQRGGTLMVRMRDVTAFLRDWAAAVRERN